MVRMGQMEIQDLQGHLVIEENLVKMEFQVHLDQWEKRVLLEVMDHLDFQVTKDRQENRGTPGWWDRRVLAATAAQLGLRVTLGKQGLWEAEGRRERWETQGRQANRDLWVIRANEDLGVQLGSRAARDRRACQGCREVQVLQGHPVRPVHLETPSLVLYC